MWCEGFCSAAHARKCWGTRCTCAIWHEAQRERQADQECLLAEAGLFPGLREKKGKVQG